MAPEADSRPDNGSKVGRQLQLAGSRNNRHPSEVCCGITILLPQRQGALRSGESLLWVARTAVGRMQTR